MSDSVNWQKNEAYIPPSTDSSSEKTEGSRKKETAPPPKMDTTLKTSSKDSKVTGDKDKKNDFNLRAHVDSFLFKVGKFITQHTLTKVTLGTALGLPYFIMGRLKLIDTNKNYNVINESFTRGLIAGCAASKPKSSKNVDAL